MARRLSGWQKLGLIAGIGCASIVVIVIVAIIAATMWARSTVANLGDPNPQRMERRIALPSSGALTAERPLSGEITKTAPLRLTLDLQEGNFTIKPGEPGSDIHVEGEYAPGLYELLENQETDPATGTRRVTVRFRSKAPAWARFFANMGDDSRPRLTVTIPRRSPIDLSLQVSMGQSEIDLGGLTLGEVSVNASMGEHRIDFAEPVVEGVRHLRVNASMGNVAIEHLGNAGADAVDASGSMGNLTANLGGAWPSGSTPDLTFEHSMGELTLRVPSNIRLDADVRSSPGRTENRAQNIDQPDDPNAPTLRLRVTTSMGNSRVIRY